MQIGKALKILLSGCAALSLAPALHAQSFAPNKLATVVSNGMVEFIFWGPNLTKSFGSTGFANTLVSCQPIALGDGSYPPGTATYGTPSDIIFTNTMTGPNQAPNGGDGGTDFMCQFVGEFIPPVTTNYTFFVSSDDQSELYLSTDMTPSNQRLIAYEDQWNNADQWQNANGGTTVADQDSSTFIPAGQKTAQYPNGIPLVAGNMYYISYVDNQTGGGYDNAVTYTYAGAPVPANGTASAITPANLAFVAQPPSFVTFTQQPSNTTVYAGQSVSFGVSVISDATPYFPAYQWQKNGVNITNSDGSVPTGQYYNTIVSAADSGAKYQCLINYIGAGTNTYPSAAATLTVLPGTTTDGYLRLEYWANTGVLANLLEGNVPPPTSVNATTNFEARANTGLQNYDERISGWFIPPATGSYVFYLNSDGPSDLFISTNNPSTPDTKILIAQQPIYSLPLDWPSEDGGGLASQKRSDQWVDPVTGSQPYANGFTLTAGTSYYIEGDMAFGTGTGDNFAATFTTLANANNLNSNVAPAFGPANIAMSVGPVTAVTITTPPVAQTVFAGTPVTFTAAATTDSEFAPQYQWTLSGTNVAGATGTSYSIVPTANENGDLVGLLVTVPNSSTVSATATPVVLTVEKVTTPPTLSSAASEYDAGTGLQTVDLNFNELMDFTSLFNPSNYTIPSYTVTNVTFFTNNAGVGLTNTLVLWVNAQITGNVSLTMGSAIQNFSGVSVASTPVTIAVDPMTALDITYLTGASVTEISTNGSSYYNGPGAYTVDASGNDIWNSQDGFRFVYQPKTNSFAVAVQVPYLLPADQWTKAGLMARETIDPSDGGSRFVDVITTALGSQKTTDGGSGENSLSVDARYSSDSAAVEPAGFIGDSFPPVYPNQWLLLTRQTDGTNDSFGCYGSIDRTNWTWLAAVNPLSTGADSPFPSNIFVGMCTTAHIGPPGLDIGTAAYQNYGDFVGYPVNITASPQSQTIKSATSASFTVTASSASKVIKGGATNSFVSYQWYTNGSPVSGATTSAYTTPLATASLNDLQVYATVAAVGSASPSNSAIATLTVNQDTTVPTIANSIGEYDPGTTIQYIDVSFNELMDVSSDAGSILNPANYTVTAGGTAQKISGVTAFVNNQGVSNFTTAVIELFTPITGPYTVAVSGVQSYSGVAIAANANVTSAEDPMKSVDIGPVAVPGTTFYNGPGDYTVNASGTDIWNGADQFRYVYTTRTNNFDIVVQVPSILPADQWSKAGLMAREVIDAGDGGSRMLYNVTTALASQVPLDGGAGQNSIAIGARDTTDAGAYTPPNALGPVPVYPNQWLRMTRQTDGVSNDLFTCYSSTNKVDWTWLSYWSPVTNNNENAGTKLTVFSNVVYVGMCTTAHNTGTDLGTATYLNFGDYVAAAAGPTLTASLAAGTLTISWAPTGGTLYSSPTLGPSATWTMVGTANPATVSVAKTGDLFFEVISP